MPTVEDAALVGVLGLRDLLAAELAERSVAGDQ